MTVDTATITPLRILKETRQLFAETHWTTGTLYIKMHDGKKKFCMVGGLCHVFAKNVLPEWLKENEWDSSHQSFYTGELKAYFSPEDYDFEIFAAVIDAEWELAKTIKSDLSQGASPGTVEGIIIDWNDGEALAEFQERGDASYVLEVMDQTIARVEQNEVNDS